MSKPILVDKYIFVDIAEDTNKSERNGKTK